jgi:DNA-binding NtrC family response regulator
MKQIKRIIIVDDDPFWTALLQQVLEDLGYKQMEIYENGHDCIAHLGSDPALIFLDYQMTDLNGLEVLKHIKEFNSCSGVVFCTAHEDLSVAIDAMKHGSFDFLLKTNATKEGVARIIKNIGNSQALSRKVY